MFLSKITIICFFLGISNFHFNKVAAMEAPAAVPDAAAAIDDELGGRIKSAGQVAAEEALSEFKSRVQLLTEGAAVPDAEALQGCASCIKNFSTQLDLAFPMGPTYSEEQSFFIHGLRHQITPTLGAFKRAPLQVQSLVELLQSAAKNWDELVSKLYNAPRGPYVLEGIFGIFKRNFDMCEAEADVCILCGEPTCECEPKQKKANLTYTGEDLKKFQERNESDAYTIGHGIYNLINNSVHYIPKDAQERNVNVTSEDIDGGQYNDPHKMEQLSEERIIPK